MPRINPGDADHYQNNLNGEWFGLKNDGDIARVQFMFDTYDEIETFACHKVKVGDKERYVDCPRVYTDPIDDCPLCVDGSPVKPVRFIVMYQHDDRKVKIWERGKKFLKKLQGLMNRYPDFSNQVFEIERRGIAGDKDTDYDIFHMDNVDPIDLSQIEYPDLLGPEGLVLQKTYEELSYYALNGHFPKDGSDAPAASAPARRRTAATAPTSNSAPASAPRRATRESAPSDPTSNTAPAPSRRGAPVKPETAPTSGSRRRGPSQNNEVF